MIALQWFLIVMAEGIAAQVQLRPERPTELWPVSISGWITLLSSMLALGTVLVRANNKPVLDRLTTLEKKFDSEVNRIEVKVDKIEKDLDRDKSAFIRTLENQKIDFLQRVDEKLNGFGRRVEDVRVDLERAEGAIASQALEIVESKGDRRQMNTRITELATSVAGISQQLPAMEMRFKDNLSAQTKEILKEIPVLFANIIHHNNKSRS